MADVWTNSVRTLTGAGLSSGSLATADDVTNAANNASSSVVALVNANTNSQTSGITSAVNNNTNSVVASASSSVVALVNANTNSATAGITSDVNANTAAVVLAASSSLSTQILINRSLISALNNISANDVWAAGSRTLTDYATSSIASSTADETWKRTAAQLTTTGSIGKLLADNIDAAISTRGISNLTASDVWAVGSRTLSDYNTAGISSAAATAVWANASRTLTNYGNNLTAAEVWNALTSSMTSIGSIGKLVGDNLDTTISSRATLVNQTAEWKLTMSDISAVQTGKTYRARLTILNNNSVPTTPFATPTVTLYDADRNVVASGVAMSALGTGIYEYTYSVSSGASQGVWETIITTQVESGKNLTNNDYWLVSGSPAQVIINSVTASTTSDISANVTITNEGLAGYEYQYEWCVVSNINNLCGGGDDSYHATGAKFINPGEDWNTNLTAAVSTGGNYYFKLVVYFGTEKSGSSRTFSLPVTEVPPTTGGGAGGGGSSSGGGGGGGSSVPTVAPSGPGIGADLSGDRKVNSVDFSILLAYWKTPYPFANKAVDINGDRKVNSVDFSILLSQWGTSGRAL